MIERHEKGMQKYVHYAYSNMYVCWKTAKSWLCWSTYATAVW